MPARKEPTDADLALASERAPRIRELVAGGKTISQAAHEVRVPVAAAERAVQDGEDSPAPAVPPGARLDPTAPGVSTKTPTQPEAYRYPDGSSSTDPKGAPRVPTADLSDEAVRRALDHEDRALGVLAGLGSPLQQGSGGAFEMPSTPDAILAGLCRAWGVQEPLAKGISSSFMLQDPSMANYTLLRQILGAATSPPRADQILRAYQAAMSSSSAFDPRAPAPPGGQDNDEVEVLTDPGNFGFPQTRRMSRAQAMVWKANGWLFKPPSAAGQSAGPESDELRELRAYRRERENDDRLDAKLAPITASQRELHAALQRLGAQATSARAGPARRGAPHRRGEGRRDPRADPRGRGPAQQQPAPRAEARDLGRPRDRQPRGDRTIVEGRP